MVDASNIVATVEAIEADPERQERLRRGARAFYDAHLAAPRLIDRWRAVLEALALRQDVEPPKIDNSSACTCDHRLPRYRACSTCLHLEDTEMAYFMGILKKPKRPRAPDPDDVVGLARALACDDGTAAALLRTYGVPQIRQAGDLKVGLWAPGDALDLDDGVQEATLASVDDEPLPGRRRRKK